MLATQRSCFTGGRLENREQRFLGVYQTSYNLRFRENADRDEGERAGNF